MRRKSLSEKEIRTIIEVMECFMQENDYMWSEMNRYMGSITIEEMLTLKSKLRKWYHEEEVDEDAC